MYNHIKSSLIYRTQQVHVTNKEDKHLKDYIIACL